MQASVEAKAHARGSGVTGELKWEAGWAILLLKHKIVSLKNIDKNGGFYANNFCSIR
jgi:hypothetical protein